MSHRTSSQSLAQITLNAPTTRTTTQPTLDLYIGKGSIPTHGRTNTPSAHNNRHWALIAHDPATDKCTVYTITLTRQGSASYSSASMGSTHLGVHSTNNTSFNNTNNTNNNSSGSRSNSSGSSSSSKPKHTYTYSRAVITTRSFAAARDLFSSVEKIGFVRISPNPHLGIQEVLRSVQPRRCCKWALAALEELDSVSLVSGNVVRIIAELKCDPEIGGSPMRREIEGEVRRVFEGQREWEGKTRREEVEDAVLVNVEDAVEGVSEGSAQNIENAKARTQTQTQTPRPGVGTSTSTFSQNQEARKYNEALARAKNTMDGLVDQAQRMELDEFAYCRCFF